MSAVQQQGIEGWIEAQLALAQSSHVGYLDRMGAGTDWRGIADVLDSFWRQAITGQDQLRQRLVFALSQIMVISTEGVLVDGPYGVASYLDMLGRNAFGNFRQLLEEVALHPAMGRYLSHLGNEREDPATGRIPDENFAREILQLFSIGLVQLNQDGTARLDAQGQKIPTYDLEEVMGFAKVFTGWSWAGPDKSNERFRGWRNNSGQSHWTQPMQSYPTFHSVSAKRLLNGASIPAGGSAESDLRAALDNIFNHPNVGPFIGYRLIQRLVSSNPSPAYVSRVSAAFANNGSGVRGDMRAVIRAILLDPEARAMSQQQSTSFGKLREPVIRFAQLMRTFNHRAPSGRYKILYITNPMYGIGQEPLNSPSVFNFFRPDYTPAGAIAAAGLKAPEFQIAHETSVVGYTNFLRNVIENGFDWNYLAEPDRIRPDYTRWQNMADRPEVLVEEINVLLLSGAMSASLRTQLLQALNAVASNQADWQKKRVMAALLLVMTTPEYLVQK